jgi:hypothetical protein
MVSSEVRPPPKQLAEASTLTSACSRRGGLARPWLEVQCTSVAAARPVAGPDPKARAAPGHPAADANVMQTRRPRPGLSVEYSHEH